MKHKYYIVLINVFVYCISFFIINSCTNDPIYPDSKATLYQIEGCQKNVLLKSVQTDSCFNYKFDNSLSIEFCVTGNCCPAKDRFKLSSNVFRDSITITIIDTAENLCRCICNYIIHSEFQGLQNDRYIIKCVKDEIIQKKLLYFEEVKKNN